MNFLKKILGNKMVKVEQKKTKSTRTQISFRQHLNIFIKTTFLMHMDLQGVKLTHIFSTQ